MLPDGAAKRLQRVSRLTGVRVSPHGLRLAALARIQAELDEGHCPTCGQSIAGPPA